MVIPNTFKKYQQKKVKKHLERLSKQPAQVGQNLLRFD